MILRFSYTLLFLLVFLSVAAQDNLLALTIPKELKENANAVIRLSQNDIIITSRKSMTIKDRRVVTVLNEKGLGNMGASEYYDKSTKIRSMEGVIYDVLGNEIKKLKRKDFKESAVSEGSVITDNRMVYLDYTPVQYPFTIVYTSEKETSNTAFIPGWYPSEGLYVSVEKAVRSITYLPELGFRYKSYNFTGDALKKEEKANSIIFTCDNIMALRGEEYSPSLGKITPHVLFGLDKFHLEGYNGEASDWASFGKWYNTLLEGTDELPIETVAKIKALVQNETDPLRKAKLVYEYVQGKTRYISIQLGIGGWKPMLAKDVDRLGYGDCKALTNYTRALLKAVGVDSYYAVIYGDRNKRDIREDFVSMQGNHVILAIPHEEGYKWLEGTSQSLPFGFQGDFTDNRMALLVKPTGGEVVRTHVYTEKGNSQFTNGSYAILESGAIAGNMKIVSRGTQYDTKYVIESRSREDLDKFYKSGFDNINNLKIKKAGLSNNKDLQEFTEDIALEAEGYCNKSGNKLIFAVNAFNQYSHIPQRYRSRQNQLEIAHGFYDTDEVAIDLPKGFTVEARPDNITITDKFGEYRTEYVMVSPEKMIYKRSLLINNGLYEIADYEKFRDFREKIARNDNAKIVLVKN